MPEGLPNKKYTPEFRKLVAETMLKEKLGYRETAERFEIHRKRVQDRERIYLTEGAGGFAVERRGRGSTGCPKKLPKEAEEDLLAEVQRLRAENERSKTCKGNCPDNAVMENFFGLLKSGLLCLQENLILWNTSSMN